MAHARPSCPPDNRPPLSALDRRHFLHFGTALIVPLLAGTKLSQAVWASESGTAQLSTDPVLDHVSRELMKIYRGVRGPEGFKGEHVRALAANLDLVAAHLQQTGNDRRLDAKLREGIDRSGRDAFARELHGRHAEIAADTAVRYGIVNQVRLEQSETGAVLDLLQRDGVAPVLRKAAPGLVKLATLVDRRRANKDGEVLRVRQKPGDDFLGYEYLIVPFDACSSVRFWFHVTGITAAALGLAGYGPASGLCALFTEALSMLYDYGCSPREAI